MYYFKQISVYYFAMYYYQLFSVILLLENFPFCLCCIQSMVVMHTATRGHVQLM